jgi:hypothetical protein
MDKKIDELISRFKFFKEELDKGINRSYTSDPNQSNAGTGPRGSNASPTTSPVAMSEGADLQKDGSIQAGIAAAGGGGNMPINSGVVNALGSAFKAESKFKEVQHKIEGEGHGKESAAKITAAIGRKSIGQEEMTRRSEEARKSDDKEDVKLAEEIEDKVLSHMKRNKKEEKKEGHDLKWMHKNPEENLSCSEHGQWKLGKAEQATNEKANPDKPHNKGKYKVMDEVKEKSLPHVDIKGKPYDISRRKAH